MEIMTAEVNSDIPTLDLVSGITTRFQQLIVKPVYNESRSFHSANAILVPHDAYYFVNNKEYIKNNSKGALSPEINIMRKIIQ